MNMIVWFLIAAPAALWISYYAFIDLDDSLLGVVGLGLFVVCLAMGIRSAWWDYRIMFGSGEE